MVYLRWAIVSGRAPAVPEEGSSFNPIPGKAGKDPDVNPENPSSSLLGHSTESSQY